MVGSVDGSAVSHAVRIGVLDAFPMARVLMIRDWFWAAAGPNEAASIRPRTRAGTGLKRMKPGFSAS